MKRRFRLRRRRLAAAALLPLAATMTTTAFADAPGAAGKSAQIDASKRSVAFGDRVALKGSFPGAGNAPIEVRYRAKGVGRTGTRKPRRTPAPAAPTKSA